MYFHIIILLTTAVISSGQPTKCDQTPPHAAVLSPTRDKDGLFHLNIIVPDENRFGDILFTPSQTYVLTLETMNSTRPFKWFMITVEDPEVDNNLYDFGHKAVEVGSLKTLHEGKYSERCANTVESFNNVFKQSVEIHWISPQNTTMVRIRAMVAENSETWYTGDNLTIVLKRDTKRPKDSPPLDPRKKCYLCSEARYEVIFTGRWSRLAHPRYYPSKPDENGFSHMIGASHDYNYTLWEPGTKATEGMKLLAEDSDITVIEREIINSMSETGGTRTLIRGKRRHHPHMHEPSHSLFRVDRIHHQFSIAVAMKPSPDWFLGTYKFELCKDHVWLDYAVIPLIPWDAGTVDGVSYESPRSVTQPVSKIERVEIGSFNEASPFYQMNLNDLKPFADLEVRRLDVYPLDPKECSAEDFEQTGEEEQPQDEPQEGPRMAESRQNLRRCTLGEWSEWSPCTPDVGGCGIGAQTRTRQNGFRYESGNEDDVLVLTPDSSCQANGNSKPMEIQHCFVEC